MTYKCIIRSVAWQSHTIQSGYTSMRFPRYARNAIFSLFYDGFLKRDIKPANNILWIKYKADFINTCCYP